MAVRAVRADQEIGLDLELPGIRIGEPDLRLSFEVVDGGLRHVVADVTAVGLAACGEIHEDVGLRVQPHRLARELLEIDAVALAVEPKLDAVVAVALA